jgi:hypothetical protein
MLKKMICLLRGHDWVYEKMCPSKPGYTILRCDRCGQRAEWQPGWTDYTEGIKIIGAGGDGEGEG